MHEDAYCGNCINLPEVINKPEPVKVSAEARRRKFAQRLLKGEIFGLSARGDLTAEQTGWLTDWCLEDERTSIVEAAALALAKCSYPIEKIRGIRKHVLVGGIVDNFLMLAEKGELTFHSHVDNVTKGEKIAASNTTIYKGTFEGQTVAVKEFADPSNPSLSEFRREVALVSILNHDKIGIFASLTKQSHALAQI